MTRLSDTSPKQLTVKAWRKVVKSECRNENGDISENLHDISLAVI